MFTFALTGRGVMGGWRFTPRAPLCLPWAMEVIGLSARKGQQGYALPWAFQPASFDRDEQSVTYSWYAKDPFKIHRPKGPSKKELTDP